MPIALSSKGRLNAFCKPRARIVAPCSRKPLGFLVSKQKKVEALRRLERVDQNLLRLRDIVEEVDHRLKGIRAQAGKARRYREYSDRLQALRTWTAWGDWQRLTQQLEQQRLELAELQTTVVARREELETAEALAEANEQQQLAASEALRQLESQHARLREQISARESAMEFERARLHDLTEESQRRRQQNRSHDHACGRHSLLAEGH